MEVLNRPLLVKVPKLHLQLQVLLPLPHIQEAQLQRPASHPGDERAEHLVRPDVERNRESTLERTEITQPHQRDVGEAREGFVRELLGEAFLQQLQPAKPGDELVGQGRIRR